MYVKNKLDIFHERGTCVDKAENGSCPDCTYFLSAFKNALFRFYPVAQLQYSLYLPHIRQLAHFNVCSENHLHKRTLLLRQLSAGIGRFQAIKTDVLLIFSFITGDKTKFLSPMMFSNEYIIGI